MKTLGRFVFFQFPLGLKIHRPFTHSLSLSLALALALIQLPVTSFLLHPWNSYGFISPRRDNSAKRDRRRFSALPPRNGKLSLSPSNPLTREVWGDKGDNVYQIFSTLSLPLIYLTDGASLTYPHDCVCSYMAAGWIFLGLRWDSGSDGLSKMVCLKGSEMSSGYWCLILSVGGLYFTLLPVLVRLS